MSLSINWFVWSCFIGQKNESLPPAFIYGFAAETFKEISDTLIPKIEQLIVNRKVYFFQEIVSRNEFTSRLTSDAVDIAGQVIPFYFQKSIIQQRLGHYAPATLSYTAKSPEDLNERLGESDEFIAKLLIILEEKAGLAFSDEKNYERLGCFECLYNHAWLDDNPPFQINITKSNKPEITGVEIRRASIISTNCHLLHLVLRNKGNVVRDRIYTIPKNTNIFTIPDNVVAFSQIEAWLFTEDGSTALHYENHHLLQEIGISGGMIIGSKIIQDKLSVRAKGKSKLLGKQAELVRTSSFGSMSSITSFSQHHWPEFKPLIKNRVKRFFVAPKEDHWFSKGIENEIEVIKHIRDLINSRKAKKAILVDPFFGYDALQRFVLRIESSDTDLTIITSLGNENPDDLSEKNDNPNDLIKHTLNEYGDIMIRDLKVLNLRTTKGNQAFHDRYLCTYDSENNAKVFLLSNSINKASGNWPFCMSLLAHDVAHRAKNYIEGLCNGMDIESDQDLEITYKWPEEE